MNSSRGTTTIITLTLLVLALLGIGVYLQLHRKQAQPEAAVPDTATVSTMPEPAHSPCGLTIESPLPMSTVASSFMITGSLDMGKDLSCRWIVFEGQAGTIQFRNPAGELVGAIQPFWPLPMDWMDTAIAGGVIHFSIPMTVPAGYTGPLSILFTEDDVTGEGSLDTLLLNVTVQ